MDIYCPKCGEPVDIDELHTDDGRSFDQVRKDFDYSGCTTLGYSHNENPDHTRAQAYSLVADLLGDDIDGIASILDDGEYLGLFE